LVLHGFWGHIFITGHLLTVHKHHCQGDDDNCVDFHPAPPIADCVIFRLASFVSGDNNKNEVQRMFEGFLKIG
jgi:hypothetical protein